MMMCQFMKTMKRWQINNQPMDLPDSNKSICNNKNPTSKDNLSLTTFMKIITKWAKINCLCISKNKPGKISHPLANN